MFSSLYDFIVKGGAGGGIGGRGGADFILTI